MFKNIFLTFIAFAILLTPTTQLSTHAQTTLPGYKVVSVTAGVNLRDANCNKAELAGFGTLLTSASSKIITCKINGISYQMINYYPVFGSNSSTDLYVATQFTKDILSAPVDGSKKSFKVKAEGGLNIRDENCKKIGAVANGSSLEAPQGVGGSIKLCQRDGEFYDMTQVSFKGKIYYVASYFIS